MIERIIIPNQDARVTVLAFWDAHNWDRWPVLAWCIEDADVARPVTFDSLAVRVAWCLVYDGAYGPQYVFPDRLEFPTAIMDTLQDAQNHVAQLMDAIHVAETER